MIHLDLFSGIGGASIAVDEVFGKENVTHIFCDNEPFAQAILKKHWPEAKIYGDIRTLTNAPNTGVEEMRGRKDEIFLLTGGFPCQPFSQAGRRKGTDDDRYLWPEMLRVIRESKPRWVIGENVAGLLTWDEGVVLEQVCLDLEGEGYEVQPFVIPACAVNAPHRRDRVWIVANSKIGDARQSGFSGPGREGKIASQDGFGLRNEPSGSNKDASNTASTRTGSNDSGLRQELIGNSGGTGTVASDTNNTRNGASSSGANKNGTQKSGERELAQHGTGGQGSNASNAASARGKHGRNGKQRNGAQRQEELSGWDAWNENWLEVATRLCTLDDGLPGGLVRPKGWRNAALKGAGNAWVPQVAIEIMKGIKAIDKQRAVE